MLLPRSLAHLQREMLEEKWRETKPWVESHITGKKYRYCYVYTYLTWGAEPETRLSPGHV